MKKSTRREIFVETELIAILANGSKKTFPVCRICEGKPQMFPPDIFAEVLQMSSREIYRRLETDQVHFVEDKTYRVFICPVSLAENLKKKLLH